MFSGAVICLIVALLAAIVNFGGLPNGDAAATAGHVYSIAMGLFIVIAIMAIFDLELPGDIRARFAPRLAPRFAPRLARTAVDVAERPIEPDVRRNRML